MESLRSDLKEFFTSRLEEVLSPLKVEASTIKLWLARVANYLERVEPSSEDPHAADLVGLFGPLPGSSISNSILLQFICGCLHV